MNDEDKIMTFFLTHMNKLVIGFGCIWILFVGLMIAALVRFVFFGG